jgi:hypothetical protein
MACSISPQQEEMNMNPQLIVNTVPLDSDLIPNQPPQSIADQIGDTILLHLWDAVVPLIFVVAALLILRCKWSFRFSIKFSDSALYER